MKDKEKGAMSIEAVISMTFFMLAILSIMFISVIIKIQAQMQYAISQTAKEISGYYYLMDKVGIAEITASGTPDEVKENLKNLDSTIANVTTFLGDADNTKEDIEALSDLNFTDTSIEELENQLSDINGNVDTLKKDAAELGDSLKKVANGDAKQQFTAVLKVFGKSMVSKSFSYFVAPLVCQALVPKYLTSGDVEEYCKNSGVNWDEVDFSRSQLLLDGRSIKIDVVYKVNTKNITFGMVDTDLTFHQVATTAAWIRPSGSIKKSLTDLNVPDEIKDGE